MLFKECSRVSETVCGPLGHLLTGEAQDQDAEKAFMVHKCLIASALKYLTDGQIEIIVTCFLLKGYREITAES